MNIRENPWGYSMQELISMGAFSTVKTTTGFTVEDLSLLHTRYGIRIYGKVLLEEHGGHKASGDDWSMGQWLVAGGLDCEHASKSFRGKEFGDLILDTVSLNFASLELRALASLAIQEDEKCKPPKRVSIYKKHGDAHKISCVSGEPSADSYLNTVYWRDDLYQAALKEGATKSLRYNEMVVPISFMRDMKDFFYNKEDRTMGVKRGYYARRKRLLEGIKEFVRTCRLPQKGDNISDLYGAQQLAVYNQILQVGKVSEIECPYCRTHFTEAADDPLPEACPSCHHTRE